MRRPDQGVSPAFVDFRGAEINEFDVTVSVDHYVRRLQVTVDDVSLVEVLKREDETSDVEKTVVV
jgi:uncharacterized ubiquitin-like protein YukD